VSQFERSEVMLKYATLMDMQESVLVKEAWTWRDVVENLGIDLAIEGAFLAGAAALGLTTITAPVVISALLIGGAISLGIFAFTKQMDDNIPDLINRLDALDTNEQSEPVVRGWIEQLARYQAQLPKSIPPDAANRSQKALEAVAKLQEIKAYLQNNISGRWDWVEANLTDWGWDPSQAKYAIDETTKGIDRMIISLQTQIRVAGDQLNQNIKAKVEEKKKEEGKGKKKKPSKPGKGKVRQKFDQNTSEVVRGLQVLLNQINRDVNAGAGMFKETGVYDWNTANALVGVISSNPRIMNLVARNAKVNFDTIQDVKEMRRRPELIKLLYRTLKSPAMQEVVEEMKRKHVPLSRRDLPQRQLSQRV